MCIRDRVYPEAEKAGRAATLCDLRRKLLEQPEDLSLIHIFPIQVNADLVHYRIERYLGGQFLERRQYESLDELIQNELAELDFDDLVSVSDEELESISTTPEQDSDDYRLLSRLKADCDYFLGAGGRAEKHLRCV